MRKIKLANAQKRDAEVVYGGITRKSPIHYTLPSGNKAQNIKILKATLDNQYETLLKTFGTDEDLANEIISGNPEINFKLTGKFVSNSQKVLVNQDKRPVYKVNITEMNFTADGTLKDEKAFTPKMQNISGEHTPPVSWSGKKMPINETYNKFIFAKKYQLTHTNGLSFDFLFDMAKELYESKSLMLVSGGVKGNEPLIFQENGKPYRAFLEGRIKGDSYLLLMHITNLELKSIL
jgi:hypothetical protein